MALAAIVVSPQDADADPSYGNDIGAPVAGVAPGAIYGPAPFGAPVIGATVPPPMLTIPDLTP